MRVELPDIRSDWSGFSAIVDLSSATGECFWDEVEIDMSRVSWLDANMCAPLGAVLYRASQQLNEIRVTRIQDRVERVLERNGFLATYGHARRPDTYGTTIEYIRMEPGDDKYFAHYVEQHLITKKLPTMSPGLLKRFRESIFEIFSNAVIHSRTELGIFSCGQFFLQQQRLDFAVADLGIGIRRNLREEAGIKLDPEEAINWAMEGKNTTKTGPIPGGLGLKLLREFITMNAGRIQIVSDAGYWELAQGTTTKRCLPKPFPGTVVNIEINTSDTGTYWLKSELRAEDVF